jgi:hypothetical protein
MNNPHVRRSIVMFSIFKFSGLTRLQAVERFLSTKTCRSFGDALTVGHVFTFAALGGYESGV